MAVEPIEAFVEVGATPEIKKTLGGPVALSPVAPYVAETGEVDGQDVLRVSDYRTGQVLGQSVLERTPERLAFSPDGQRLLVLGSPYTSSAICYAPPWDSPQRGWDTNLRTVYDGAWLDAHTAVVAGEVFYKRLAIALLELGSFYPHIVHQEDEQPATPGGESRLDSASCSTSGLVAFAIGYGQHIVLYRLSPDRQSVVKERSFIARADGNTMSVALDKLGDAIIAASGSHSSPWLGVYSWDGVLNGHTGLQVGSGHSIAHANGVACFWAWRGRNRERSQLYVYSTKDGALREWASHSSYEDHSKGLDVCVQGEKTLLAVEYENRTRVYELTDVDVIALGSSDVQQRCEAALHLGERRYRPGIRHLARCLSDDDQRVRVVAASALGHIGDEASLPHLIRALGQPDWANRKALFAALRGFPPDQLARAVAAAAARPYATSRRGAAFVAQRLPSLDVLDVLHNLLHDSDEAARLTAIQAVQLRRDLRSLLPLLPCLAADAEAVRQAARDALLHILGTNGYLPPDTPFALAAAPDFQGYTAQVIATGRLNGFATFGDRGVGGFLTRLAAAIVGSGQPLPAVLNTIEALAGPPGAVFASPRAALGLLVTLACAEALQTAGHAGEAGAVYGRAVELAQQANAPAIEWRAWQAVGACHEALGNDAAALEAYRNAVEVIDRLWFALLEEDKLRHFFADKALLYDQAVLCCLRLGYATLALEYNEKAKTRYLGDLIARRQMDPHETLARDLEEFWRVVHGAQPVASAAGGPHTRERKLQLVGVAAAADEPDGASYRPEQLAAFEEANPDVERSGWFRDFLRYVWQLMGFVAGQDDEATHEALEDLYGALSPVAACVRSDALPIGEPDRSEAVQGYGKAADALRGIAGGLEGSQAPFWAFGEYRGWLTTVCNAQPDDPLRLIVFAVLEALNSVLHHEPVWVVPVDDEDGNGRGGGLTYVVREAAPDPSPAVTSTAVVTTALERATRTKWRYVTQLARGEIAGYRQLRASLAGRPDTAHLQCTVTEQGTVTHVVLGQKVEGSSAGPLPALHGPEPLHVFTCPDLTLAALADLLMAEPRGWFPRYRDRRKPGGQPRWLGVMDHTLSVLYERLIEPLRPTLQGAGVKRLQIVPHRGLHAIPWAALHSFDGRHCLVDDYEITMAPSTTLLQICRERAGARVRSASLTAIANPTLDLPFSDDEVTALSRLVPAAQRHIWRGAQARRAVVLPGAHAGLWHFAGHGHYDWSDPLVSRLLFAGPEPLPLAALFAEELSLAETNVVVLSACETTVVDPRDQADEYLGLASGFLFAGAPAVISSLWAVDDASTGLLMRKFYEKHLQDGHAPAQALREAQLWLRDEADAPAVLRYLESMRRALEAEAASHPERRDTFVERSARLESRIRGLEIVWRDDNAFRPFAHPYYWAGFTCSGIA